MGGYDVTVGKDLLPGLLGGQDGLAKLLESVLNEVLEAQVSESVGAERYERHEERVGYRNGDMKEARRRLNEFVDRFQKTVPKSVACLEEAFADAMVVMVLPEKYRKRLRTTNMQERLNEEIRRRERVIRIFPNDESALRMFGSLLAEKMRPGRLDVTWIWMNLMNG